MLWRDPLGESSLRTGYLPSKEEAADPPILEQLDVLPPGGGRRTALVLLQIGQRDRKVR